MGLADAAPSPDRRESPPARAVRWPVVAIAGLVIVCLVGGAIGLVDAWWRASSPSPDDEARAAALRGRHYLRLGRPELAFEAVHGVRDDSPAAGEAMAVAGQALIRMGQYRVARMALERALKLKPDQFEAAVTLGELNLDLGNTRRGADALAAAVRLRPRESRVWRLLARARADLNEIDAAAGAYRKVLDLGADRADLIESLGFLVRNGRAGAVASRIDRALREYPNDPAILGFAARRAFDEHRLEEAQAFAERAIAHNPSDPDALHERARCLIARARWVDALSAAERAVAAAPDEPGTLQLLRMVQVRLGRREEAAGTSARYEKAQKRRRLMVELNGQLDEHPDDPEIRTKIAKVAMEAGSYVAAYRCFEAAIALGPGYQPAVEGLAALKASHPELARGAGPYGLSRGAVPGP